jgi:hypothetical protein
MQKDNTGISNIEQKDIQESVAEHDVVSMSLSDTQSQYIYSRSTKISKALFLVTQNLPEGDPVKKELRGKSIEVSLKTLNLLKDTSTSSDVEIIVNLLAEIHTVSDIAASSKVLSHQSYEILKTQITKFATELKDFYEVCNRDFSESFSVIPGLDFNQHIKDSNVFTNGPVGISKSNTHQQGNIKTPYEVKDKGGLKISKNPEDERKGSDAAHSKIKIINETKNDRQLQIIEKIKEKGESSIKDLTDVITGCSEKTIQRELIALVASGDLLKTGERRWSRYSIAK